MFSVRWLVTCHAAMKCFTQQMTGSVEAQKDNELFFFLGGGGLANATAYQGRPSGKH